MVIYDFFGFSLERTSALFQQRCHTSLFNVPASFESIAGGVSDTLAATSFNGQSFSFRNKDILSGTIVVGMKINFNHPNGDSFVSMVNNITTEQLSVAVYGNTDGTHYFALQLGTSIVEKTRDFDNANFYHTVEFTMVPGNDGTGSYELRVDGFPLLKRSDVFVGTGTTPVDGVHIQITAGPADIAAGLVGVTQLNALWISDRFLGSKEVEGLHPSGNGTFANWDITGAVSNTDAVDESEDGLSDEDSSYVTDNGGADTYKMEGLTLHGKLDAVTVESVVKDTDLASDPINFLLLQDNSLSVIGTKSVTESVYTRKSVLTQPTALTKREIDKAEFGQGATGADPSEAHNTIVFIVEDAGVESYALYDNINAFTGDDPANVVSQIYVQSPVLDSVAASGVTLLNAYANSKGSSSWASMLTGLYAFQHSVGSDFKAENINDAEPYTSFGDSGAHTLLSTLLKDGGVLPCFVGQYGLDVDTTEGGGGFITLSTLSGFDTYAASFRDPSLAPYPSSPPNGVGDYYHWTKKHSSLGTREYTYSDPASPPPSNFITTVQIDDAIIFADTLPEPFVLVIRLNATGGPRTQAPDTLVATAEYKTTWPGDTWENNQGNLEAVDSEIGRFLTAYDAGREARTSFMFLGGNGASDEVLSDLSSNRDVGTTYDSLLAKTGEEARFNSSCYDRGGRIPCVLWGAKATNGGRTSDALFHVCDVLPTILDLQGITIPDLGLDNIVLKGESAFPVYRDAVSFHTHQRNKVLIEHFGPNGIPSTSFQTDWDIATAYTAGLRVWYNKYSEWECLQTNTGNDPTTSPTLWKLISTKFVRQGFYKYLDLAGLTEGFYSLISISERAYELYLLKDSSLIDVDPYQLTALDISSGGAYEEEFEEILEDYLRLVVDQHVGGGILPDFTSQIATAIKLKIPITDPDGVTQYLTSDKHIRFIIQGPDGSEATLTPQSLQKLNIIDELGLAGVVNLELDT